MRKAAVAATIAAAFMLTPGLPDGGAAMTPCATEGAPGPDVERSSTPVGSGTEFRHPPCYWDAQTRGNGQGRSFVVTPDSRVIYAD